MIRYDVDFVLGASWPERGALHCTYLLPPDPDTGVKAPGVPAGYIARAQWRSHPNSSVLLLELTPAVNYTEGSWEVSLDADQTPALGSLSHWGLQLESPDRKHVIPLVEGRFNGSVKTVRQP